MRSQFEAPALEKSRFKVELKEGTLYDDWSPAKEAGSPSNSRMSE
jgi:hypothetical protein